MNKWKFSAMTALVILFLSSSVCLAQDAVQPRGACPCGQFYLGSQCLEDYIIAGTGTHSYGFGKTCKYILYRAHSGTVCISCGTLSNIEGPHDCYEEHLNCSRGIYKFCPIIGY